LSSNAGRKSQFSASDLQRVAELRAEGYSDKAIAEEYGVHSTTIYRLRLPEIPAARNAAGEYAGALSEYSELRARIMGDYMNASDKDLDTLAKAWSVFASKGIHLTPDARDTVWLIRNMRDS
jgi:IS30 family transposase